MKNIFVVLVLLLIGYNASAQYNLTKQQQYLINEWRDAYGGKVYYAYNYPKAYSVYKQLKSYTGMDYPIIFHQTFSWGQAHHGGLIILDYSTINKNKNILAYVFAHEWAHQALGHQANIYNPYGSTWRVRTSRTETEDEADVYAGKFLAAYGYDIDMVYNYLYNLPENNNKHDTHSPGRERAKLVLKGYKYGNKEEERIEYEYIITKCSHPAHPRGDIRRCTHQAHPRGDISQCSHRCTNYYGYIVPCHPNGDVYNCTHPQHPNGDISNCIHLLHSNGHKQKVRKY